VSSDRADLAIVKSAGADLLHAGNATDGFATMDCASIRQMIVRLAITGMVIVGTRTAAHAIGYFAAADVALTESAVHQPPSLAAGESANSMHYKLEVRRLRGIGFPEYMDSMNAFHHKPQVHPLLQNSRCAHSLYILHHRLGDRRRYQHSG
jgi:hypothetical protein